MNPLSWEIQADSKSSEIIGLLGSRKNPANRQAESTALELLPLASSMPPQTLEGTGSRPLVPRPDAGEHPPRAQDLRRRHSQEKSCTDLTRRRCLAVIISEAFDSVYRANQQVPRCYRCRTYYEVVGTNRPGPVKARRKRSAGRRRPPLGHDRHPMRQCCL